MTEAEWFSTKMPLYMLRECPGEHSERKVRLAGYHCLQHAECLLTNTQRAYIEAVARLVEQEESIKEVGRVWLEVVQERPRLASGNYLALYTHKAVRSLFPHLSSHTLIAIFRAIANSADYAKGMSEAKEKEWQCHLIRDIFGNPFRPVSFRSGWRTDTAITLARQMYDSRDFSAMPILADALQDAGCDNEDILSHCRDSKATHVRGCWVVDLVLGKQ